MKVKAGLLLVALAAAACDVPGAAVGQATRASLTGAVDTDHAEVCAIKVTAPPDYGPGLHGIRTLYDLLYDLYARAGWIDPPAMDGK